MSRTSTNKRSLEYNYLSSSLYGQAATDLVQGVLKNRLKAVQLGLSPSPT